MISIHPTAEVKTDSIGEGTIIWQHAVIQEDVMIGTNCKIGANVFIEEGVTIGNNVTVKNNISIYKGVTIEDNVFLGPSCVFTNVLTPRSFISRKKELIGTRVENGASIGANATIICGHTIGEYAMVGAGSVVTNDVPNNTMVYGNPATPAGYVCECGCRLDPLENKYKCRECGKIYTF